MTTIYQPIKKPEMTDMLSALKRQISYDLNCVKVGRITKFDPAKKTAEIQILFKRILSDRVESYPVLVDCPVFTLQGGKGYLQMPIKAGDDCIVLFSDRNIDAWWATGNESAPLTPRAHDLSDGIALVGINSLASDMPTYDENVNMIIPSGKKFIVSGGAGAEILGTQALALFSELQSLVNWAKSHTHSGVQTGMGVTGTPSQQPSDPTGTTKLKGA